MLNVKKDSKHLLIENGLDEITNIAVISINGTVLLKIGQEIGKYYFCKGTLL